VAWGLTITAQFGEWIGYWNADTEAGEFFGSTNPDGKNQKAAAELPHSK
jgi:hypothetical protein